MSQKELLIIAFVWPEPASTAAGNRMLQLIHYFLDKNFKITIASTAAESDLSMDLDALGIKKAAIQLNNSSFDEFIAELNPDVVLFDRFLTEEQFGWRVAEFTPNALRILDTEDLHSLRNTRAECFKKGIPFSTDEWLKAEITIREIASIYRSDISLIISTYEMFLLKDVLRIEDSILMYLPFMLDPISTDVINSWEGFENRTDFICIGNGKHAPNINAIVWLKKEIWPLIRKQLPEANLKIYGAYLPERIQQMHKPSEGFLVEGWAKDAKEVFGQARVNLAPIRFGAGLKGKLITAMQNGLPSVTTAIGAEGMIGDLEFNGSISETAETIAQAAIALYTDEKTWRKSQANGAKIINTIYEKTGWLEKLDLKIDAVLDDLKVHRTKNFIGTMLGHQTMTSTKYMSKWIEQKNR